MGYATAEHHKLVQRLKSKLQTKTIASIVDRRVDEPIDRIAVRAKKITLLFAPASCNAYELVYDYIANTPGVVDINGMKFLYFYRGKVYQLKELIPLCSGEISAPTLRSRLDSMSIEEALQLGCPRPAMSRSCTAIIEYCGIKYKSKDLSMLLGVDLKTLARHVHKTPVITKPLQFFRRMENERYDKNGFVLYAYAGHEYNILALAKKLGVEPKVLFRLLRVKKMFIEDAIAHLIKE